MFTSIRILFCGALLSVAGIAQSDHLSADEIRAATAAKSGTGTVYIQDAGFATPSLCQAQMPGEFIYTPEGRLNSLSAGARKQFLPFQPSEADTLRSMTIISQGCASGTAAGPVCDSITRVVLLSDPHGTLVVESTDSRPLSQAWQNGFGARAACSSLVSKFPMDRVRTVQNKNGEFIVATFSGTQLLKLYTVKAKHLKSLDMLSR